MSPLLQPMNEFSVTSLLNLLPLLQTDVLNVLWKDTNEHCEACICIIRFQGEVDMQ